MSDACVVKECKHISTVISALQTYQNINDSKLNDIKACLDSIDWKSILHSYHHILFQHLNGTKQESNQQFEQIFTVISENMSCDIQNCRKLFRNQRDRDRDTMDAKELDNNDNIDAVLDHKYLSYLDTFDSIHCHLLHSYDTGFRIKLSDLDDEYGINNPNYGSMNDAKCNKLYKDDELLDVQRIVTKRRSNMNHNLRREQRSDGAHNKFRMQYYQTKSTKDEKKNEPHKTKSELTKSGQFYSFGHRYYYWPWYKDRNTEDKQHNPGYAYSEWYIVRKYRDLKQELLDNQISQLTVHKVAGVMTRVSFLMDCDRRKQILSDNTEIKLHYDIKPKQTITKEHLLAVTLYTNFDALSFNFSLTFRKQNQNETDEALKERNREYWNWSKLLREVVECFGTRIDQSAIKKFYHGCSYLIFPLFIARFCCPISTTIQIEVATVFSNSNGVILEIGKYGFRSETKYFNCTWLSHYGNEDERLFIGGYKPLQVLNIRLTKKNESYFWFIKAMTFFNKAMDGKIFTHAEKASITKRDYRILDALMSHEINEDLYGRNKFPPYVNESFHAFCGFKQQIQIDIEAMQNDHPKLSNYFMQNGTEGAVSCDYIKSLFKACKYIVICKQHGASQIHVSIGMLRAMLSQMDRIEHMKSKIKLESIKIYHIECDAALFSNLERKFLEKNWTMAVKYSKKKRASSVPFRNLEFTRQ